MSSVDKDDRFAPPQAHVQDVALPNDGGPQLATRKRRLAATIIDMVIFYIIIWLLAQYTPWNLFVSEDSDFWHADVDAALASFVLLMLVNGYLLVSRGQSVGKALLGMRIVRPDGARVSALRLLGLREGLLSLINVVPSLGAILWALSALFIFRSSRRCLHDQIADTIVIKIE
jgi:uncharacterized RDD family membrane protein YckC